jgi:hypothetical protein
MGTNTAVIAIILMCLWMIDRLFILCVCVLMVDRWIVCNQKERGPMSAMGITTGRKQRRGSVWRYVGREERRGGWRGECNREQESERSE